MGMGVAASLLRRGFGVRAYDVRAEAMERWAATRRRRRFSPAEVAAGAQAPRSSWCSMPRRPSR